MSLPGSLRATVAGFASGVCALWSRAASLV